MNLKMTLPLLILVPLLWSGTTESSILKNSSPEASISEDKLILTTYIQSKRSDLSEAMAQEIAEAILQESESLQFPTNSVFFGSKIQDQDRLDFLVGVVQTESRFLPLAKSHKGALGCMQIMPPTAQWVATRYGIPYRDKGDLKDPKTNLRIGVVYLNELLQFTKTPHSALLAYNAGPSAWKKWGGVPAYAKSVHKHSQEWKEFKTKKRTERLIASVHAENQGREHDPVIPPN